MDLLHFTLLEKLFGSMVGEMVNLPKDRYCPFGQWSVLGEKEKRGAISFLRLDYESRLLPILRKGSEIKVMNKTALWVLAIVLIVSLMYSMKPTPSGAQGIAVAHGTELSIEVNESLVRVCFENQSDRRVKFYDSINQYAYGPLPAEMEIRFQDSNLQLLRPRASIDFDHWHPVMITSKAEQLVGLEVNTLEPGEKVSTEFELHEMASDIDESTLEGTEYINLRCHVKLWDGMGMIQTETGWLKIDKSRLREPSASPR